METENTAQTDGVRYSLRSFNDGRRFVDVQARQDEFDGLSVSEMNRKAKQIIKEQFAGKVIGQDNRVFVNGASTHEYVFPSKSIDQQTREVKLRAAPELDNILDAGTNLRNEPDGKDGHVHPNAVGGFDYYDTVFKIGNEYYAGVVNVEVTERGRLLKDVTKIRNITQDIISSYGSNPKSDFLRDASMDSISNPADNVNENSSTGGGKVLLQGNQGHTFEVELGSVASAGDGKLVMNLQGGGSADVSNMSFPNTGMQELYRAVAKIADSTETAQQLLDGYFGEQIATSPAAPRNDSCFKGCCGYRTSSVIPSGVKRSVGIRSLRVNPISFSFESIRR